MDDYPKLVFHSHSNKAEKRRSSWRFSIKDVIILLGIASAMSGLMGLGSIMVIDFVEALMRLA
jgi:hypothetical protein